MNPQCMIEEFIAFNMHKKESTQAGRKQENLMQKHNKIVSILQSHYCDHTRINVNFVAFQSSRWCNGKTFKRINK